MYIATTRFSNKTYVENYIWKLNNNYSGAIYGSPHRICEKIAPYKKIIVIEMNNDLNLVMGIGCVKNYLRFNKTYKIHKESKYNRYVYKGKKRIDRENIEPYILEQLEYILFTTSQHYKRLRGITCIPVRRLGEKLDNEFNIGDRVKKIKGSHIGVYGIIVGKKGEKIKVRYEENNVVKFWSFRYALGNYVKINKKQKQVKKEGTYKCRLCGSYKKNHYCISVVYSKKLKDTVYNYLLDLFKQ